MGLSAGPVPTRVEPATKAGLLELVEAHGAELEGAGVEVLEVERRAVALPCVVTTSEPQPQQQRWAAVPYSIEI